MRRSTLLVLPLVAALLAGCAAYDGEAPESPSRLPTTTPEPTVSLSLAPESAQPSPEAPISGDERISGTLGADAIEGGCGYLEAADGTRYEVIYPDGWDLSLSPLELRSPDGEVVATGGDEVTVTGEIASDMASICQIGPIFRAESVGH